MAHNALRPAWEKPHNQRISIKKLGKGKAGPIWRRQIKQLNSRF